MGKLGDWAADHANEIFELNSIDALTAYIPFNVSIEDLEGKNLSSHIKLRQFDKSLREHTQKFYSFSSH
jgi:hypothetical protein